MSILLVDATAGLFNLLGTFVYAIDTLNTSRGTTVLTEVTEILTQYKKKTNTTLSFDLAVSQIPSQNAAWQQAGSILTSTLSAAMRDLIIEFVNADANQSSKDFTVALKYLIADIAAQAYYVDPNAIGASLAASAANSSTDLVIAYSTKRGDGLVCENAFAEAITVEVTSAASELTPSVRFTGQRAVSDSLSSDWPLGSGCNVTISATDAGSSLLDNGDFQDESANLTDMPDVWIAGVGTAGTHFALTDPEIQTIAITGSPSAGQYFLQWQNPSSINRATTALAYNATASDVQSALREIPGLELVTVSASGSTPNYTHTVTFTGVAGNINQLTSINNTTGGTITHGTSLDGTNNSYKGAALDMIGNGSTLTTLYLPIGTLDPETVYFIHYRHKKSGTPAAGIVRFAIVDAVGGSVTTDFSGNSNSQSYDLTAGTVTTSWASGWFSFRLKKTQSQPIYLQIKQTTAISAGTDYYLDELAMVAGRELYKGGPFGAAFSGKTAAVEGDKYTLTITNDRAGDFQTAFDRAFDLKGKGLLLPSSGSTNISDGLIA